MDRHPLGRHESLFNHKTRCLALDSTALAHTAPSAPKVLPSLGLCHSNHRSRSHHLSHSNRCLMANLRSNKRDPKAQILFNKTQQVPLACPLNPLRGAASPLLLPHR
jgi:hypothetical protein